MGTQTSLSAWATSMDQQGPTSQTFASAGKSMDAVFVVWSHSEMWEHYKRFAKLAPCLQKRKHTKAAKGMSCGSAILNGHKISTLWVLSAGHVRRESKHLRRKSWKHNQERISLIPKKIQCYPQKSNLFSLTIPLKVSKKVPVSEQPHSNSQPPPVSKVSTPAHLRLPPRFWRKRGAPKAQGLNILPGI